MARSLAILALAGAAAAAWPEEDNVVVLDDKNFDQFLKETPLTIVEFYAPWCGHCKELAPKWAEAAKRAKALSPPIPVAKLDADAHGDLAQRFGVSGYPTIKVFRDGLPEDYDGSREADGIVVVLVERVRLVEQLIAAVLREVDQLLVLARVRRVDDAHQPLRLGVLVLGRREDGGLEQREAALAAAEEALQRREHEFEQRVAAASGSGVAWHGDLLRGLSDIRANLSQADLAMESVGV